jgi:hypothetical protein
MFLAVMSQNVGLFLVTERLQRSWGGTVFGAVPLMELQCSLSVRLLVLLRAMYIIRVAYRITRVDTG